MSLLTSRARALVLVVAAVLLSTIAFIGLSSQANAVTYYAPPTEIIDKDKKGSIVVEKHLTDTPGTSQNAGGLYPPEEVPGAPVQGVTFKLQRVTDVDLTTNEGFRKARELAEKQPKEISGLQLGEDKEEVTDDFGWAVFEELPVGLYVVSEQPSPDAIVDGEKVILNPSDPFFVFLPMTDTERNEWNYDISVFPKNSTSTIKKEVKDSDKHVGDTITYEIKSDIPVVNKPVPSSGATLSKYQVVDKLDPRLSEPKVTVKLSDGMEFSAQSDYTVNTADNKVLVDFTEAGRKKLAEKKLADNSAQVHTTITAKVGLVGETNGQLENQAFLIPNEHGGESDIPSNKVVTKHGKVKINKTFKGATEPNKLQATFELYHCSADGTLSTDDYKPIRVNGHDEFTTENGVATIDGLQYNNFRDGAEVTELDPSKDHYCLVEKKTADGYELLPAPIPFQITDDTLKGKNELTIDVENVPTTGVTLPFTGGSGVGVLLGIGAVIVAGGIFLAVRTSRKKARG